MRSLVGRSLAMLCTVATLLFVSWQWSRSAGRANPTAAATETFAVDADLDWPQLLGPYHNGISLDPHVALDWPVAGPPQLWRRTIGTGYSAPVVQGGRLVATHREQDREIIECCDAASGETLWKFDFATNYQCPHAYSGGPYSTPVIADGRVFAWSAEGQLHCLDLATGKLLWERHLSREYNVPAGDFPVASSPLVEGGRVLLNVGSAEHEAGIVAINVATGKNEWAVTREQASYATPVAATIHGQRYVFVFTYDGLVAIDPADGRVFWSVPFHAKVRDLGKLNASSPVVWKDCVIVSCYPAGTLCIRVLADGKHEQAWKVGPRVLDSQFTTLICREGYLYGCSSFDRSVRCLDLDDGKLVWKWDSPLGRAAPFIAVRDQLLLLGEYGQLALLATDPSEAKSRCLTDEGLIAAPCFTSPVLAQGRLYLRNETTLACYDLRPKP